MSIRSRRAARTVAARLLPDTAVDALRAHAPRPRRREAAEPEPAAATPGRPFSYEEGVALLVSRGVDEQSIRVGSISETTMKFAGEAIARYGPPPPLRALHVGNFVGLSLTAFADAVARNDPDAVVVSIDPNLSHLGVHDPQRHVLALVDHFGLSRNNLVICGYSLERSDNATVAGTFTAQPAGENVLENLARLGQRFDIALIDGNHDQSYLRRELAVLVPLLGDGALLMLDDVWETYTGVRELFDELAADSAWPFQKVDQNERLGVLRRTATRP